MLHSTLLLLLLVSFTAPTPAQADSILYVKPTEGTKCPGEPCHILDEYVNETHRHEYFPYNNTVIKFLPGTHNLSEWFNFHHLTNLTLEATSPAMNETVIFCTDHPHLLLFTHGSQIAIEGLSIVNCGGGHLSYTLLFHKCAYISLSRVTIEGGNIFNGIAFKGGHSINVSLVVIHLQGEEFYGIFLDGTGDCIIEEVEVINWDPSGIAIGLNLPCESHDQSQYMIRRCSFELAVVIQSANGCYSNHFVILENVFFKNIVSTALALKWCISVLLQNVIFANNTYSGTSVVGAAVVDIDNVRNATFIDCEFYNNFVTPISADQGSSLQFSGTIFFQNNTGYDGGAMSCTGGSYVYVSNHTNVIFENNTAENAGGAVFVNQDTTYCFFRQFERQTHGDVWNCPHHLPFNLTFVNNTALNGGDAIYGAGISDCIYLVEFNSSRDTYCKAQELLLSANSGLYFEPDLDSDPSLISSDPTRVCLCENGTLNCSITSWKDTRYPGEEFTISAMDVGDTNGPVDGPVYAQFLPQYIGELGGLQYFQQVNHINCTELKYSVLSKPGLVVMALTVNTDRILGYQNDGSIVYVNVTLLSCPLGFNLSAYPLQCICDTQLKKNNIPCNITTQTIQRSGSVWVNASFDGNISNGVIVHKNCPFGYCKTDEVHVNLKQPDTQCAFDHSGTLCGACQPEFSLALGSPQCLSHCSNDYISLLVAFAIAGFLLVLFIKILDLTVAVGMINGLIFYANIIQAAQYTFIPAGDTNPLTVFIAWLNLDLGIETCFFHGLDSYWKTWLQFVFPFYIWAIILVIIYFSRWSQTVASILGKNSVPVLATLILLSYTKLFRTIVSALTFTYLEFPDGSKTAVWSFDANIEYLSPKHIPLFLVALGVLLFLWLPFTVLLLFEQCFQRIGTYTVRKWMLRLKPFFDAYFGPLRGNHRYWIGMLLVARGILLLVFGPLNFTNNPSVNLLAVNTVIVLLLMYTNYLPYGPTDIDDRNHFKFWIGSCYKKWYLSLLESSFLCNLAILSAITLAIGKQAAVVYTSVGITFCQFIGMVIYQAYVIIRRSWERDEERQLGEVGETQVNREDYEPIDGHHRRERWPPKAPYRRMDQCREPLLEEN